MRWLGIAALASVAVAFLLVGIEARATRRARKKLHAHLPGTPGAEAVERAKSPGRLVSCIENTATFRATRMALHASGLEVRSSVLAACTGFPVLLVPLACYLITGQLIALPLALTCMLLVPRAVLKLLERRRERNACEECRCFVADLALFLRSGIPLDEALRLSARDAGDTVGQAISAFSSAVRLGRAPEAALSALVETLGNADLALMAQAVMTSRETGSDIRKVMDTIGETVRERAAIEREISSQTVQARLSGRIVAALPLIFLALSALASRSTLAVLFGTTQGILMLCAALVMNVAGFLWIRKILNISQR